jgi:predicted lysophospholipase L1 biosynthesis ABC-type transport system permease subunit
MSAPSEPPLYKGEPLDADRGPGLGCFWVQVAALVVLLVLTPLTVIWAWDERVSAVLLIATLVLLFFTGQTIIFLLRLVAADRRTRRRPLDPAARRTVGQLEDTVAGAGPSDEPSGPDDRSDPRDEPKEDTR